MGDAFLAPEIDFREGVAPGFGRIDAVLAALYPELSRARIQRLIAAGHVTHNGEPVRKSLQIDEGDTLTLTIPVHAHARPVAAFTLPKLFEDEQIVVIDKPAGLATHGAPGDEGPSVASWFVAQYPEAARHFDAERPGIVHRLDKDTSGVLLLVKTPEALTRLGHAFEARETEKWYLAVCDGVPAEAQALIDAPIARHPGDRTRMAIAKRGREAKTGYEVLGNGGGRSLLLVRLHTGRTHQIRVHLAAINVPVAGDRVYNSKQHHTTENRQLLHAWRITAPHPDGGTLTVTASLPADIEAVVRAMGLDELASKYGAACAASRIPAPEGPLESPPVPRNSAT